MKAVLLVSASMFALSAGAVVTAPTCVLAGPASVTLWDQNNEGDGKAVTSSNFTSGSSTTFTSYGADDFVIPAGHKWRISEVDVSGQYAYGGPATSENVLFYTNSHKLPGRIVAECDNIKGTDNDGSFVIKIPKTCKVVLKAGTRKPAKSYWVSVVANVDFVCCGYWFWDSRSAQNRNPSAWENPENGFFAGCTTWTVTTSCTDGYGEGPDFMFSLKGRDTVSTPAASN